MTKCDVSPDIRVTQARLTPWEVHALNQNALLGKRCCFVPSITPDGDTLYSGPYILVWVLQSNFLPTSSQRLKYRCLWHSSFFSLLKIVVDRDASRNQIRRSEPWSRKVWTERVVSFFSITETFVLLWFQRKQSLNRLYFEVCPDVISFHLALKMDSVCGARRCWIFFFYR